MRAVNDRQVIHKLVGLGDPLENRIVGGVADFRISSRGHGRRAPRKGIGCVAFYAQFLDPVALVGIGRVALPPEPDVTHIRLVDNRRAEDVDIAESELEVVVRLHLIESREGRRKSRSHPFIQRGIHGETPPKVILGAHLMVDSRGGNLVVREALGSAKIVPGGIGAVGRRV